MSSADFEVRFYLPTGKFEAVIVAADDKRAAEMIMIRYPKAIISHSHETRSGDAFLFEHGEQPLLVATFGPRSG